jgi:putative ATPase
MERGLQYKYPHNYKNHYVSQEYLPDDLKGRKYYKAADNKLENKYSEYQNKIRKNT